MREYVIVTTRYTCIYTPTLSHSSNLAAVVHIHWIYLHFWQHGRTYLFFSFTGLGGVSEKP